jgi:hypothetical protein
MIAMSDYILIAPYLNWYEHTKTDMETETDIKTVMETYMEMEAETDNSQTSHGNGAL